MPCNEKCPYTEIHSVPAGYVNYIASADNKIGDRPDELKWSGTKPPPAVGEIVRCRVNNIGKVKVKGYFTEHGWLGVLSDALEPPEWFTKQNGSDTTCHLFGAEMDLS